MNFEGKPCGNCMKGKLAAAKKQVAEGVHVDGYKCTFCKEYSFTSEVMKKIYALERVGSEQRGVVRVGNSLAVIIPAGIAREINLKEKNRVDVRKEKGKIIIQPAKA